MDSGNSGSISSSGDEEYDSRADQSTLLPSTASFFNHHPSQLIGSISHPQSSNSLVSSHHHPSAHSPLFDLSSTYLHSLSHSQPNSNPNNFVLDLDTGTSQTQRSEPNCTDPTSLSGSVSSSAATATGINQCLLTPQGADPSLQLRSVQNDNATTRVLSPVPPPTNVARNSKKRTRASRRAPTTVLTTDTTNFRAMVQEFTGIPAPPFSSSSYSRRLDLLSGSASTYYPLRPLPQKVQPNSLLLSPSSSSPSPSPSPSTLLHNNMVDATNNSSCNSSINYQLHPDLGLPYHQHQPPNMMLSMQNQPILSFQPPPTTLHPLNNTFGSKSQASLPVPSLEDLGMNHGQVNEHHLVASGVSIPSTSHGHVISSEDGCGGGRRDLLRSLDGSCKLNFSASASSSLNHEKTLENNNSNSTIIRGEGTAVDSWICSSD